jgi:hypothetical protein
MSEDTANQQNPYKENYSKAFTEVTPVGVARPEVPVLELCPEPSRLRVLPPALRPRDEADFIELNGVMEGAKVPPVLLPDLTIPNLDKSPARSGFGRGPLPQPSCIRASPLPNSDRCPRVGCLANAASCSAFAFAAYCQKEI